jgi:hypothetical protein
MAKAIVRTLADLGPGLTLAPERHLAARLTIAGAGVTLGSLVALRNERVVGAELARAVSLDTTHAKDGVLDVRAALAVGAATSPKKRVHAGDLLVSRLRPYLRQIALVHPAAVRAAGGAVLACSTEYYVLRPQSAAAKDDLAYLVPFLLAEAPQAALAAGQEGGHHPRVPVETLLGLGVPRAVIARRQSTSTRVRAALDGLYEALDRYRALVP